MAIVKIVNVATVKAVRRAAFESDSESDDDDETDRLTKKPKKSLGTKDDVDVSQMLDNIRRRHASGTFTKLVLPAMTWIDVVSKHATTFPWIRGIQGDLRMRKIMEVLPTDPVSIRLHVCRRKLNADVEAITEEFVHLQSVLDGLQAIRPPSVAPHEASDGPLSWHSIAAVFKRASHRVLTDRQSLTAQTQQYQSLMHAMQRFVVMNVPMVEERTNNTRLLHTNTPDGAFVNSLQGHFHEADRFIVVIRQVEHDEVHVCGPVLRQRHYRSWMEVRQVSPTHIIMRTVGHLSRVFRARDGFVSTTELAMLRGIDLTGIQDDQKDAYVWREFIRRANAHFVSWRRRFTALMQEESQHHHDNHED
ncbi:hypothetical protein DYB26_007185 [Aphanomyces astaci]|uniref:Uncharacterized protein n=1 Tax=Aphanomyces astaci TaxID=112090 RepID=A0A397FC14_APHAT|nr:hypothetical protein DYB26_007185 [Aphanomyces astaci]RHZ14683.1 hypothetical protein DYB31_004317 [Aphanomyces astaci]